MFEIIIPGSGSAGAESRDRRFENNGGSANDEIGGGGGSSSSVIVVVVVARCSRQSADFGLVWFGPASLGGKDVR